MPRSEGTPVRGCPADGMPLSRERRSRDCESAGAPVPLLGCSGLSCGSYTPIVAGNQPFEKLQEVLTQPAEIW
jgi:hypothetical protein